MLVCENCGGKKIEVKAWVDANTNKYIGEVGEGDLNIDDCWCNTCEEHTNLIDESLFIK